MTLALQPLDQIIETFELLDDWEDRYRYMLDLAKTVPEMAESAKTEENEVKGCTSKVWMTCEIRNGAFHFVADSNAHIVRGLIGILMSVYQDKTPDEIKKTDIKEIFERLGLEQNLSPNRRSGFFAMVERIKKFPDAG